MSSCSQPAINNTEIKFREDSSLVDYEAALAGMEQYVADMLGGTAGPLVWFLSHPSLYTAGTSAKDSDLLRHDLPVFKTGRGGEYTYHGPGQRVAYVMLDLRRRGNDVRRYVYDLEEWLIRALANLGVTGERRVGRVGIWVDLSSYGRAGEAKIAAIGVRVRRGIAFHGVALNVNPDLSCFQGIVPCGIRAHGVTSLHDLGISVSMDVVDQALRDSFLDVFHA